MPFTVETLPMEKPAPRRSTFARVAPPTSSVPMLQPRSETLDAVTRPRSSSSIVHPSNATSVRVDPRRFTYPSLLAEMRTLVHSLSNSSADPIRDRSTLTSRHCERGARSAGALSDVITDSEMRMPRSWLSSMTSPSSSHSSSTASVRSSPVHSPVNRSASASSRGPRSPG